MIWRKFNGDPIDAPILEAVEKAIKRETANGYRLKAVSVQIHRLKVLKPNLQR